MGEKVARRALARLAEIGWCESRRGTRSVVADRGRNFRGHVLFYLAETVFGFHAARLVAALRSQLLKANYRLTAISADDLKKDGSSQNLSESLQEHWDLVIEMGTRPGSRAAIERAGWPFLVLEDGGRRCTPSEAANYVGRIVLWNGLAVPEFVAACAARWRRRATSKTRRATSKTRCIAGRTPAIGKARFPPETLALGKARFLFGQATAKRTPKRGKRAGYESPVRARSIISWQRW